MISFQPRFSQSLTAKFENMRNRGFALSAHITRKIYLHQRLKNHVANQDLKDRILLIPYF